MKYFQESEFFCHCGKCEGSTHNKMVTVFLARFDILRGKMGFPFPVRSGYRCPEYNQLVSTTGLAGPHTTGMAADIGVDGKQTYEIISVAKEFGFRGIGVKMHGPTSGRLLHLDILDTSPRPNVWSYP
jgi:uncharacterized protein YcbK (DUF882 family)